MLCGLFCLVSSATSCFQWSSGLGVAYVTYFYDWVISHRLGKLCVLYVMAEFVYYLLGGLTIQPRDQDVPVLQTEPARRPCLLPNIVFVHVCVLKEGALKQDRVMCQ